jgi:hypothetical protein
MLILLTILFTTYIIIVPILIGRIPNSISETYYALGDKFGKPVGNVFTLWLMAIGISVILLEHVDTLLFLSGSALCFAAVAARYKDSITDEVHYTGSALGFILTAFTINLYISLTALVIVLAIQASDRIEQKTFWQEVVVFYILIIGLLVKFHNLA